MFCFVLFFYSAFRGLMSPLVVSYQWFLTSHRALSFCHAEGCWQMGCQSLTRHVEQTCFTFPHKLSPARVKTVELYSCPQRPTSLRDSGPLPDSLRLDPGLYSSLVQGEPVWQLLSPLRPRLRRRT